MLLIPPLASSDRIVRPWRQLLLCAMAVLVASCLPGGEAWAQTPPTTAADYARRPMLSDFNVAPSNRHAAFLLVNDKGRQVAGVIDLEKPSDVKVVAAYADANVTSVRWINDRRLVYEAYQPGALIDPGGAGTFAVDLDGERRQQLISWVNNNESTGTHIRSRVLTYGWHVWRSWDGRGDDVLAYRNVPSGIGDRAGRQLVRLDSIHGTYRNLSFDQPPFADTWGFDAQGELRLIGATRNGREKLFLRASGQSEWAEIEDEAELSDRPLQPLYIEGDGTVIVLSRRGRDTLAMHTYDPKSRVLGADALAAASSYDIGTDFETDGQARLVVGVHLHADRLRSVWFDEGLVAAQRTVDEALPKDRFNRLLCGNCLSAQRFVVRSSSDRISAEYFVYDRQKRSLVRIGTERPWLPEASQGRRTFHRLAARDGLSLPVVITHPSGREADKNLPAVVLVHGGPWLRGTDLRWSDEAQFLASRGYRVLEVDFRGSTGLGSKHFQAGWKQWGLSMQDDLADAVGWAVKEGWVDAGRVCIAGSSYGGYAALMGPIRHPGTYRCAASYAGVTDLMLMFSGSSTDVSLQHRKYSYPTLLGDPKADAERLRQTSPLHRVADIKVPVLVAQGSLDRRVTKEHADTFESAARAAGVDIERVTYADEAHSWFEERNHTDYLQRIEKLLARTLKASR